MGKSRRRKRGENPWQKENGRNGKGKKKTRSNDEKDGLKYREKEKRFKFFEKNYRIPKKSVKEIMEMEEAEKEKVEE